jgi:hypothetical protein
MSTIIDFWVAGRLFRELQRILEPTKRTRILFKSVVIVLTAYR